MPASEVRKNLKTSNQGAFTTLTMVFREMLHNCRLFLHQWNSEECAKESKNTEQKVFTVLNKSKQAY